jgi:hypothetical protein
MWLTVTHGTTFAKRAAPTSYEGPAADETVIEAVAMVFRRFAELGSARPGDAVATRGRIAPSTPTGPHRADSVGDGHLPGMHYFLTNPC